MKLDGNTERYGIELDLLITKFKNKVNQVKNDIKSLGQETKANVTEIPVSINMKTIDKDMAKLREEIAMLTEMMAEYQKYGYQTSPFYAQLSDQLNTATTKLQQLKQAQAAANEEMKEAETISTKSTVKIGKNFNSLTKKISRYALSLFSLGTIYSLLSRASSAYLSQDTELANKLQSAWVGLGAILSPLIEKMADLIIRLVGYINVFAQALTGVNYIAQATSKYMNNVANSAKKANKQLASFDELTNLNDSSSLDTTTNPFAPFEDLELNPKIVKNLQDLAYWLKENWNWIKLVGEIFLAVFVGAKAVKLINGIGKIAKALGVGSGSILGSLQAIAAIAAIVITIKIVSNIIQEYKELQKYLDLVREAGKKYWKETVPTMSSNELFDEFVAKIEAANKDLEKMGHAWNIFFKGSYSKDLQTAISISGIILEQLQDGFDITKLTLEQQATLLIQLSDASGYYDALIRKMEIAGEDTSDLVEINDKNKQAVKDIYEMMLNQGVAEDDILEKLGLHKVMVQDIVEEANKDATVKINLDTSQAEKDASNFVSNITKMFNGIKGTVQGALYKITVPSYDVGTNYVPSDTLAMVHKGEAIIPRKFNSSEYFGGINSGETNALLTQVIDRLDNMNLQPYVTVKDVGQASINYINEQNRYQGRSVIK